jgi:hypothetical protein
MGAIQSGGGGAKFSYHNALSLNHCRWRDYGHVTLVDLRLPGAGHVILVVNQLEASSVDIGQSATTKDPL